MNTLFTFKDKVYVTSVDVSGKIDMLIQADKSRRGGANRWEYSPSDKPFHYEVTYLNGQYIMEQIKNINR